MLSEKEVKDLQELVLKGEKAQIVLDKYEDLLVRQALIENEIRELEKVEKITYEKGYKRNFTLHLRDSKYTVEMLKSVLVNERNLIIDELNSLEIVK